MPSFLLVALACTLLFIAMLSDVATRTIPNPIPLGILGIGAIERIISQDVMAALIASAPVLMFGMLCWRRGWLGGGDVKLGTACAWLMSPTVVPLFVWWTAIAGGVLAGLYLLTGWFSRRTQRKPRIDHHPRSLIARIQHVELWRIRRGASLPYGCAIATGSLLAMSSG
jgi:prepilin peptidase CpaA